MLDKHDLISRLKDLAVELGRTPSRDEFRKLKGVEKSISHHFTNYAMLVQAADLDPVVRRKPMSASIFEKDIDSHLEAYRKLQKVEPRKEIFPHAAIISDIHFPFHSQRVIDRYLRYISDEKPQWAVLAGDAWDLYSHAKFPRSHNVFTPKEEEALARKGNEDFWKEVLRTSPKTKCVQLLGNHDVRPLKRTLEVMPTVEHWIKEVFTRLFTFEGVETIFDPREELYLSPSIIAHHGYRSKLGDHRDYALMSMVVGHTHRPGVVWRKVRGSQIFEMNCGLAGDPNAKGLTYTSQKITDWVNSFGVIDEDGPRNIIV